MQIPFFQVDAFTDQRFAGKMQRIAATAKPPPTTIRVGAWCAR